MFYPAPVRRYRVPDTPVCLTDTLVCLALALAMLLPAHAAWGLAPQHELGSERSRLDRTGFALEVETRAALLGDGVGERLKALEDIRARLMVLRAQAALSGDGVTERWARSFAEGIEGYIEEAQGALSTSGDGLRDTLAEYVAKNPVPPPSGKPFDLTAANGRGLVLVHLAAGQGARWGPSFDEAERLGIPLVSQELKDLPKVVFPLKVGDEPPKPMAKFALDAAQEENPEGPAIPSIVIVGQEKEKVMKHLGGGDAYTYVTQPEPMGTGHAVFVARDVLKGYDGDIIVSLGDNPGVDRALMDEITRRHQNFEADIPRYVGLIVTGKLQNAGKYGRIVHAVRDFRRRGTIIHKGSLVGISEWNELKRMVKKGVLMRYADRSRRRPEDVLRIKEINSGMLIMKAAPYFDALREIKPHETKLEKFEYYATDVVDFLVRHGFVVEAFQVPSQDQWKVLGPNTYPEFHQLEQRLASRPGEGDGLSAAREADRIVERVGEALNSMSGDTKLESKVLLGRGSALETLPPRIILADPDVFQDRVLTDLLKTRGPALVFMTPEVYQVYENPEAEISLHSETQVEVGAEDVVSLASYVAEKYGGVDAVFTSLKSLGDKVRSLFSNIRVEITHMWIGPASVDEEKAHDRYAAILEGRSA